MYKDALGPVNCLCLFAFFIICETSLSLSLTYFCETSPTLICRYEAKTWPKIHPLSISLSRTQTQTQTLGKVASFIGRWVTE